MKLSKPISLSIILLVLIGFSSCNEHSHNKEINKPYLIILSLDGFRWDYCDFAQTPTFDSLAKAGTKAESIVPCFPTKTFPNHYSIATGLYPDNHGIVLNGFYAPDLDKPYAIRNKDAVTNGEFYGGTPMWNVAESNNIKTATLFWVGASAEINNQRPSHWSTYFNGLELDSRIDSIVNWLSLPVETRPHLIMWYYKEPDNIGHNFGPDSPELIAEVEKLDAFVGDFFTAVRKLPIYNQIDFIVTSDHGMAALSSEKEVYLTQIIDTNDIDFFNGGNPIINLKVAEGKIDKVYNDLINGSSNIEVWKHNEVPPEFHYGTNVRTQDITVLAKPYWSLYYDKKGYANLGTHGYSNKFKDMHAIFYAAGPSFKTNHVHPTFNNIDIYPLVGKILDIDMPQSDGKLEHVIGMIK